VGIDLYWHTTYSD
jgi:hypothetical protein